MNEIIIHLIEVLWKLAYTMMHVVVWEADRFGQVNDRYSKGTNRIKGLNSISQVVITVHSKESIVIASGYRYFSLY